MIPKSILLTSAVLASTLSQSFAEEVEFAPKDPWYQKSIASKEYGKATAHEPNYQDKELWPEEMQKAAFVKQAWPKTRVLVWSGPTSGESIKGGLDLKYWSENGKPATIPIDEETDLVIPNNTDPSKRSLGIGIGGRKYQPASFRHLTIGSGFYLMGHFSVGGNIWIKKGAGVMYLDSTVGKENTFLRNDNGDIRLVDHFHFKKAPSASCEMIGQFSSDDNWQIETGLLILAPDSRIASGNRTDTTIHEKGALALMSGSYHSRRLNCDWGKDLIVKGKFSAGLPDRPLTRDARLALGYKSKGSVINSTQSGGRTPGSSDLGLLVAESGSFKVFSATPGKVKLILNCHKLDQDDAQLGILFRNKSVDPVVSLEKAKAIPKLSDMVLLGDADMSHVQFDDILKGGIRMADPSKAKLWTNVTYGSHNGGTPEELISEYKQP